MKIRGGMPVGKDGRIHTIFTHNPSSLRLSSHSPNLQNLPRGNDSEYARYVKEIFIAPKGSTFWEIDFSAIEAVLVGYFAGSPRYIRFAKLGVHAYLASHIVGRPADLSWSNHDLRAFFKELKSTEKVVYDTAKRCVHGSNYRMTPGKMHLEYPETFPTTKDAARLQGMYFELFPEIPTWHEELCFRVDGAKKRRAEEDQIVSPWDLGVCYAQNPFGYRHEFYNVLDWTLTEIESGERIWHHSLGEDAKRLISFLPQSTAAAIIKQAAKRLWYEYPWVGQHMRLLIHDSIIGECREDQADRDLEVARSVMEASIPELPLPPEWEMGDYLTIGTEAKRGNVWATMH